MKGKLAKRLKIYEISISPEYLFCEIELNLMLVFNEVSSEIVEF